MADPVLVTKENDITTITLNRPEIGNRQTDATWAQVTQMFDEAAQVVAADFVQRRGRRFLHGPGSHGASATRAAPKPMRCAIGAKRFQSLRRVSQARAPIIGVVQGRAVGLGCALAALCDITIASDKARFSFPETAHRIMPTIAFSALVDRMPRKAATFMIYSAQEIDARQSAHLRRWRATWCRPMSELAPASMLVEHFKKMPLAAVLAVKEYARTAFSMSTQAATDFARNLHATVNSYSGMR